MSAKKQVEKEIREACVFLREKNMTIPSETIQFMLDASIEKLNKGEFMKEDVICPECKGENEYSDTDNGYRCAYTDCMHEWKK